jgi:hypothetical protein
MRIHHVLTFAAALTVLMSGSANAQARGAAVMTAGLWEITMQTRSPIVAAPISHTVCIAETQVTRPEPPKSRAHDDCQVLPDAAAANQTAYTVRCAKRQVTTTARFTYSGDHYEGTVTIKSAGGEVQQVYTAVRIGDCDPSPGLTTVPPAH